MKRFEMPESMKLASIWVVWGFLAIGALGSALFVVLDFFGVKDQAAAWVQAVGSIAAIIAAIGIASHQHRQELRKSRIDHLQRQHGYSVRLLHFIFETHQVLEKVSPAAFTPGTEIIDLKNASLFEMLRNRLNSNFDDDLDAQRLTIVRNERLLLNGVVFILRQTTAEPWYGLLRDQEMANYLNSSQSILNDAAKVAVYWEQQLAVLENT